MNKKLLGAKSPHLAGCLGSLYRILKSENKPAEAETSLRAALVSLENLATSSWQTFPHPRRAGWQFGPAKKYAEAESLILSCYKGLVERKAQIPPANKPRIRQTIERLVQLYEATDQPDKVAKWKKELEEFSQPVPETKSAPEPNKR